MDAIVGPEPRTLFTPPVIALLVICLVYLHSLALWRARSRGRPLPPGPRALPIIGNVLNWPQSQQWLVFRDWCAKFGDIIHFRLLGQHILVLGSPAVIFEFLEKRSANTSDRPYSMMYPLTGVETTLAALPYGPLWRRHKRVFWQHFHPGTIPIYHPVQKAVAHRFLGKLLKKPSEFKQHIRFTFAATIIQVLYGKEVKDEGDEVIGIIEDVLSWMGETFQPGKFMVEVLPFLRHIPAWFPGATVQRMSVHWRATMRRLKEEPFRMVKAAIDNNENLDCIVGRQLEEESRGLIDESSKKEVEDMIKNLAAVTIEGGADTVFSTMQSVFLALSLYPEVQKKAQAELDAIVGPDRLPDFADRPSLVYINALMKESLRWQNVTPLSLAHGTMEDDELQGYFIPAGTIIFSNVWACMHDPAVYKNPEEFRPERFIRDGMLDPTVPDPASFVFGFGRRLCPGRYFADHTFFINIASVLHVFDITPPEDEHGQPITIEPRMTDGILTYPEDCRCTIKPRSAEAEALILSAQKATVE